MFNLETAIAGWRQTMRAAGLKASAPLAELESHLREEMEQQIRAGLSETEAFQAAILKIGPAPALQNEFKKLNRCHPSLPPQYFRSYCYIVAPCMLFCNVAMLALNEIRPLEFAGGVLLALYTVSLPRWHRWLANPQSRWVQTAVLTGGFFALTWPVWAALNLLPAGILGNLIGTSLLPAWCALGLAYLVFSQPTSAEPMGSTPDRKERQYV